MTDVRRDDGFTIVELVVTMAILSVVMGGISALFVSGTKAEADLTARFNAMTELHVGLDRMRRDVHSACSIVTQSTTSVTFNGPPCDGTNQYTWCTSGGASRFGLYRVAAASCSGTMNRYADFLTSGAIFSYLGPNETSSGTNSYALARLHVDITVDATPANATGVFRVVDDIVFRNSARCTTGVNCP